MLENVHVHHPDYCSKCSSSGFKGQATVILPSISHCYECTVSDLLNSSVLFRRCLLISCSNWPVHHPSRHDQLHMHTPPTAFPICTIANTPRLPEHCIEWASVLEWPKFFKGVSLELSSSYIEGLGLILVDHPHQTRSSIPTVRPTSSGSMFELVLVQNSTTSKASLGV